VTEISKGKKCAQAAISDILATVQVELCQFCKDSDCVQSIITHLAPRNFQDLKLVSQRPKLVHAFGGDALTQVKACERWKLLEKEQSVIFYI